MSGDSSKRNEFRTSKKHVQSHVHFSIIHNSQDMETTQISTGRLMDKENVPHTRAVQNVSSHETVLVTVTMAGFVPDSPLRITERYSGS